MLKYEVHSKTFSQCISKELYKFSVWVSGKSHIYPFVGKILHSFQINNYQTPEIVYFECFIANWIKNKYYSWLPYVNVYVHICDQANFLNISIYEGLTKMIISNIFLFVSSFKKDVTALNH